MPLWFGGFVDYLYCLCVFLLFSLWLLWNNRFVCFHCTSDFSNLSWRPDHCTFWMSAVSDTLILSLGVSIMSWYIESDVLGKGAIQNVQWWGCLQDRFEKHCFNGLFSLWETINTSFSVLLWTTKQQPLRRSAILIHVAVLSVSGVDRLIASQPLVKITFIMSCCRAWCSR